MRLYILAVGRIRERHLRAVADGYLARIQHYVRCDEIEARDAEGLSRAVPAAAFSVALEVDGEQLTSLEFSRRLEQWASRNKGDVAFLIGGSEGLPRTLSDAAGARLSLSRMTLPHRLARVVLLEQIYRAMTLLRGEPYAREG